MGMAFLLDTPQPATGQFILPRNPVVASPPNSALTVPA